MVTVVVSSLISKSEEVFYHYLRTLAFQHFRTPVLQTIDTKDLAEPLLNMKCTRVEYITDKILVPTLF